MTNASDWGRRATALAANLADAGVLIDPRWRIALLCHRLGADHVASIELHQGLAADANDPLLTGVWAWRADRSTPGAR